MLSGVRSGIDRGGALSSVDLAGVKGDMTGFRALGWYMPLLIPLAGIEPVLVGLLDIVFGGE